MKNCLSGLGPTRLICPKRTFINCGSSSNRVFRRNIPTLVLRSSTSLLNCGPCFSASTNMLLNLMILNGMPLWPIRSCRKNTGPLELILMAIPINRNNGEIMTNARDEKAMSMNRFRNFCQ